MPGRTSLALLLLIAATALMAAPDASARSKCKKGERAVEKGTPAYSGPGLGFGVTHVFPAERCVPMLRTTEDGSFALVPVDAGRVGWVALGIVDADLSEDEEAEPRPVEQPYEVLALRAMSLRAQPRFDGQVLKALAAKEKLRVTGTSPDGLWLYVETSDGKGPKGWVSRYQTAATLPEADSPPRAGEKPWVIRGPTTTATPIPPPPEGSAASARADAEGNDAKPGEDTADTPGGEGGVAPVNGEGADGALPPAGVSAEARRLVGRGHEIGFAVSVGQWSQRYLSDAQNDPFYKYELSSTGPAVTLGYAFRDDFPLVADARLDFGLFGFEAVPPGGNAPVYTSVFSTGLAAHLGWRLHGDEDVDLEAGAGVGGHLVWVGDLDVGGQRVDAFTPGLYLDALRPYVAARARLGGGDFGLVSLEAAVPLGAYLMVYDPGTKYLEDYKDIPIGDAPKLPRPGDEPADPNATPEPPILHPAVGVEARLRYALPLGDTIRLRAGFALGVRQTFLSGPGVRVRGIYTEATNIDLLGSLDLGVDFSF